MAPVHLGGLYLKGGSPEWCPVSGYRGAEISIGASTPRSSLQELPEKWKNTKKMATTVRQQVAPLQANEVALLRQRCTAFDTQQQQFRERFHKEAPFRCGSG